MKRRSKTGLILLAAFLVLGMAAALHWMRPPAPSRTAPMEMPEAETALPEVSVYEIMLATPAAGASGNVEVPDLGARIRQSGVRTVLAVLPPGSAVIGETKLALRGTHTADVSGVAEVPAAEGRRSQRYRFCVAVNFLASGDTECEFPEFEPVD